ncbi:uncharacterized protein LOC120211657 [Hibiscus syriacus]|uniref:uncharacterized protein LOC120211657 n=1 Tax=Hibiscus syriacus TaxID=106335 RepID=UPI001923EF6C|nr:uncharacterized protein LOC120211657 [Hibiscus syriacus]
MNVSWSLRRLMKMRQEAYPVLANVADSVTLKAAWFWKEIRIKGAKVFGRNWLLRWSIKVDGRCCVCIDAMESIDNFFECSFAKDNWRAILRLCGLTRQVRCWKGEVKWAVANLKSKPLLTIILKLAWNAHIYLIWEERNCRLFREKVREVAAIFSSVKEVVRIKLQGRNITMVDNVTYSL